MRLNNYLNEVTQDMLNHFNKRTNLHIALVVKYLQKIIELDDARLDPKILEQEKTHDQSKFEEPEYTPYLHVSWGYYMRDQGKAYEPSTEIKGQMQVATFHHVKNNKHHPEAWDPNSSMESINSADRDTPPEKIVDGTKMPDTYIASMVADWLAMSEEKNTDPYEWVDKNINKRWKFTTNQVNLINDLLDEVWK
jgi:hypothetical protein